LRYDKLLIATGVRNRRRPIPGLELKGIYDLRSVADADALRAQIAPGRTAVVVGMGFIGSEVAASLRAQGLNVVTIHPSPTPLFRVLGEDIGRVLAAVHHDHGVDTIFNDVVTRFEGRGSVERAVTRDGRRIDCDLVVLGVGVEPVVDLARESGIDADDGILVDEYCRASADDVFAAGDVANHYHPLFQRRMRVEHWQNAIQQGAAAARSMLGYRVPYDAVHWFWSDQYDVNVQYAGVHGKWDQIVFRGAPATRSFLAFYLNGGRVDAIAGVNRGKDLRRALPLIRARSMVEPRQLADEDVDLRTLVRTETPDSHLSAARDSDH
jgi:3-phenylpropionate/trans-cinnamate dioxygenase ferredoxin reductase subunit